MKYFVLVLLIAFSPSQLLVSQTNSEEEDRRIINEQTKFVNLLIHHLNTNLNRVKDYQEALNEWAQDEDPKLEEAPYYSVYPFLLSNKYKEIKAISANFQPSEQFDNIETLDKLYKQTLLFNQFCQELKNATRLGSVVQYYEINMNALTQLEAMSTEWVDKCYDFSAAAWVNFPRMQLPKQLEANWEVVKKCKNLIFQVRNNHFENVQLEMSNLNLTLSEAIATKESLSFSRHEDFNVSEAEIIAFTDQTIHQGNEIAAWGEQYLQGTQSQEEVIVILENMVKAFNFKHPQEGIATAYNSFVAEAAKNYNFFIEEPMFFIVDNKEIQILEEGAIQEEIIELASATEELIDNTPIIQELENTATIETEDLFVAEDKNSLAGALPTNLIILLDVSASMKLTGKLPILKNSIEHLIKIMRPEDKISLIAYSGKAEVLIASAGIANVSELNEVLNNLTSSGGTDITNAMLMAFDLAEQTKLPEGNNRIIIASDGMFGVSSNLLNMIKSQSDEGITTSIFHLVEPKELKSSEALKRISQLGNGTYSLIVDDNEAIDALVTEAKQPKI